MRNTSRIYVAGHSGLVGSSIVRKLEAAGHTCLLTAAEATLDLTDRRATDAYFEKNRPDYVFVAAAKVGGILANHRYPADFARINLAIQSNVIDAAHRFGVQKLLFLGSSCIYPKFCPQPMQENHLLTGKLEPTNDAYAIAKIAGILMCKSYNRQHGTNFIAAMPTNLYGPNDNFDLQSSHVLPAMIRKFHEARTEGREKVSLWGTGAPKREFLFVDDLADALLFLMLNFDANTEMPDDLFLNVGTGEDVSIRDLAQTVARIVGYEGEVEWDTSMPDGTPRKLLDVSKLKKLGWRPEHSLEHGIGKTYRWFLENKA
jgi:GDP-L-fucose synthase